tara:strand:+ start:2795 stop:3346 length:552 start_codon:yes stop_codon:yes gene_type:complete
MDVLKKDFKFKLIKNFFSQEEIDLGVYYFLLKHKRNRSYFDEGFNNNEDSFFVNDCFADSFLMKKWQRMQEETKLKLIPTYSCSRVYTFNSTLQKHKDRPSCEVSVTAMWGSDGTPWPIYIDGTKIDMQPGDAVIYLGCELEHWREPFQGDWHAQTFLHYVDENGPNKDYAYDQEDILINVLI